MSVTEFDRDPQILGYTTDTMDFNANTVVLVHNASLATSTSDDTTGTLRVKSDNIRLYNIDVRNDFGVAKTNGQAIALSAYGGKFGAYACRFFSYQVGILQFGSMTMILKSSPGHFVFKRRNASLLELIH